MHWSRRRVVMAISALYLLIPLFLAAYSLNTIRAHAIPIPTVLSAFTIALPFIAGLSVESTLSLQRRNRDSRGNASSITSSIPLLLLLIYETAVAALTGTYLHPISGLRCGLEERWQAMYHTKNEAIVRAIQDAFECCGFNSARDRAWPFGSDAGTCETRFSRSRRCLEPWRAEERRAAGMMMAAVLLVFAWKALVLLWPSTPGSSWFDMLSGRRANGEQRGRRQLGYHTIEDSSRYFDESTAADETAADGRTGPDQSSGTEVAARARQNEEHERWAA